MGGACSTHGGEEMCIQGLVRKPEGKRHLEDPGLDGRIILKCIFRKFDGGMGWIDLGQKKDGWRNLMNAVKNVLLP